MAVSRHATFSQYLACGSMRVPTLIPDLSARLRRVGGLGVAVTVDVVVGFGVTVRVGECVEVDVAVDVGRVAVEVGNWVGGIVGVAPGGWGRPQAAKAKPKDAELLALRNARLEILLLNVTRDVPQISGHN